MPDLIHSTSVYALPPSKIRLIARVYYSPMIPLNKEGLRTVSLLFTEISRLREKGEGNDPDNCTIGRRNSSGIQQSYRLLSSRLI